MELETIKKVTLNPEDIVVVRCHQLIRTEERAQYLDNLRAFFPDNKCILLDGGMELDVIAQPEAA